MSVQHVREVPAVFLDEQVRDRVQQAVDEMDTTEATRYAIIAGLKPPTAGEPGPLIWVRGAVQETADLTTRARMAAGLTCGYARKP